VEATSLTGHLPGPGTIVLSDSCVLEGSYSAENVVIRSSPWRADVRGTFPWTRPVAHTAIKRHRRHQPWWHLTRLPASVWRRYRDSTRDAIGCHEARCCSICSAVQSALRLSLSLG